MTSATIRAIAAIDKVGERIADTPRKRKEGEHG
jgi:hypothetical protein